MSTPARILIVDDHPLVREGLKAIFNALPDITVVGTAASVREALEMTDALRPDLVISDMSLLDRSGLELIKELRALHPGTPVLIISMHDEKIYAERVLRAGGRGYLMKDTPTGEILEAVRTVLRGGIAVSRDMTNSFLETMAESPTAPQFSFPMQRLTDREMEVFELIGLGKNSHDIARLLNVSPRTVDAHRTHIREKLHIPDSNALLAYAIKWSQSGESG